MTDKAFKIMFGVLALMCFGILLYNIFFPNPEYVQHIVEHRGGLESYQKVMLFNHMFFLVIGGFFTFCFIKFDKL